MVAEHSCTHNLVQAFGSTQASRTCADDEDVDVAVGQVSKQPAVESFLTLSLHLLTIGLADLAPVGHCANEVAEKTIGDWW